jgi:hypothetical protein
MRKTVPWYVSAFLKLIGPFIDPVTKSKIKYNEPLVDHVPASQLMVASGGEVDFQYDHSIYWPALANMAAERRQQRKERWEKAGKLIGESEIYLWGGEEGSVGAQKEEAGLNEEERTGEKINDNANAPVTSNGTTEKNGEAELVDGVEKLDIKTAEPIKVAA